MHVFSMTCKVDSVLGAFSTPPGRERAIHWFREHGIGKVYLESYRHGISVDAAALRPIRDEFLAAGLEVGGCITTTRMSRRQATWDITTCFTDPAAHEVLQREVETAASLFDRIILDDFFFCTCECEACAAARGGRDWGGFRTELMLGIARDRIITPARAVNPRVRIIVKYPLWYENFYAAGYDVLRETELFDFVWMGTETREPNSKAAGGRPQTSASWIQGWMNDLAGDKCGGAWYDPIDTRPETFVEQARQSILGGARESLLHCYDYLATDNPGLVIHGNDLAIEHGVADAEAFRRELPLLRAMADLLSGMDRYGVLVPKAPNVDIKSEAYLPSFVGMLGIPAVPSASLKKVPAAFLGVQAGAFPGIADYLRSCVETGVPVVVTDGLLALLMEKDGAPGCGPAGVTVLRCPPDLWELVGLPPVEVDALRNRLLKPLGLELSAPARVSLHLFGSSRLRCEALENFSDAEADVRLRYFGQNRGVRTVRLTLPGPERIALRCIGPDTYEATLPPRSLLLLATREPSLSGE